MFTIDKVTCSDGKTYAVGGALDWDRHTRASLLDLLAAHLRATGRIAVTTSVTDIAFRNSDDGLLEERQQRRLFTSYTDSFIA